MSKLTIFGALTVIILSWSSGTKGQRCEYIDMSHCVVYCTSVSSLEELTKQLKNILTKNASPNLTEIVISDMGEIKCMPSPESFNKIPIERLVLRNFTMKSWYCPKYKGESTAFSKIKVLSVGLITGMELWNWDEVDLYTGMQVESLFVGPYKGTYRLPSTIENFYGNHVTSIGIEKIDKLELEDSSLHCPECDWLHITDTNIINLRKQVFGLGLSKVKSFYFMGNQTASLPKDIFQNFNYNGTKSSSIILGLDTYFLSAFDKELIQPLKKTYKEIKIKLIKNHQLSKCDCTFAWILEPGMGVTEAACTDGNHKKMKLSVFLKQTDCKKGTATKKN